MIVEVNEAGEILIPAELVRAAPRTRLEAGREGDFLVLKPLPQKPDISGSVVDSLPVVQGRMTNPNMTFRREDIYGPDAR